MSTRSQESATEQRDRLIAFQELLEFLPLVARADYSHGQWSTGVGFRYFAFSRDAARFIEVLWRSSIIHSVDWPSWQQEVERLQQDRSVLELLTCAPSPCC